MVLIFLDDIDGNALELAVRSQMVPFLGTFLNNSNHVSVPIDKFFKTDNIWARLFNIPRFSTQNTPLVVDQDTSKYLHYTLSEAELIANNYPLENRFEVETFLSTEDKDWPLIQDKPQFNKILTIDCEMVQTNIGYELARISIINEEYQEVYNKFVKPKNTIVNYHYRFSGIKPENLIGPGVLTLG